MSSTPEKELAGELQLVEDQIYRLETRYLEATRQKGNILTGLETYGLQKYCQSSRRSRLEECERLFSLSSFTSPASRNLQNGALVHQSSINAEDQSEAENLADRESFDIQAEIEVSYSSGEVFQSHAGKKTKKINKKSGKR